MCDYLIASFKDKATQQLFETENSRWFGSIARAAVRKLVQLDTVKKLDELHFPPGNHLEAMRGDRTGQHSIRINDQFRICFRWTEDGAHDVEIVDYH